MQYLTVSWPEGGGGGSGWSTADENRGEERGPMKPVEGEDNVGLGCCCILTRNFAPSSTKPCPKASRFGPNFIFWSPDPNPTKQVHLPYMAMMQFKELQTAEAPAKHRLQCRHCRGIIGVRARAIADDSCAAKLEPWMNGETLTHPVERACEGFAKIHAPATTKTWVS